MPSPRPLVLAAPIALILGCGGASQDGQPAELIFEAFPFEVVASTSGQLHIEARWSPAMPVKGQNALQLTFLDAEGNAVEGISASVLPWMPAHGHGTSIQPTVATAGPGVNVVAPVVLYMSGEWQLRMTLSGAVEDTAVAHVRIP